jgi:thioredoxin-dependent peroxiredoxin
LADYRDRYAEFHSAGAEVVALSVDDRPRSEAMARELELPFPILCDPRREVVERWGLLNRAEKGGIAFPATFVIDRDRKVRFRSLEKVGRRATAPDLLAYLRALAGDRAAVAPHQKRVKGAMFRRAIGNMIRRGIKVPRSRP